MQPLEEASERLVNIICRHPILGFPDLEVQSPTKEKGTVKITFPVCSPDSRNDTINPRSENENRCRQSV